MTRSVKRPQTMSDLNHHFLTVAQCCRNDAPVCGPEKSIIDAARLMREQDATSVVVCEQATPIGIVTDRDLRDKVVAQGLDPYEQPVRSVMTAPVVTIRGNAQMVDAVLRMSRHRIHHLVVLDDKGLMAGLVTESDICEIQKQLPLYLFQRIEEAATIDELHALHHRVQELVELLLGTGVNIRDLIRLIARLNDQVLLRLIQIVRERYTDLSDCFAFVVLGSQGRGEQTLTTDQDTAVIYADGLAVDEVRLLAEFCREVIDAFVAIGIPYCPGATMASSESWRRSSDGWRRKVDHWFSAVSLENIINVAMFCDMRTLYGDPALERDIKQQIANHLGRNDLFLMKMAANVHRIRIPLGFTGRIKTEPRGAHQGILDIKRGGIFTITEGIKVLALESKILDGGTLERMEGLVESGTLNRTEADNLLAAFDLLISLRLRFQVESLRDGKKPDNTISLDRLNRMETGLLKLALEEVRSFQRLLQRRFRLGLMTWS